MRIVVTHKKKKTRSLAFTIVSTNLKNRSDNRWGSVAVSNNRPTLIGVLFSLTCAIVSEWPQRLRRRRSWKHHLIDISRSTWLLQLSQKAATTCSQSQQTVHLYVLLTQLFHLTTTTWLFQVDILLATGIQKTSVVWVCRLETTNFWVFVYS